MSLFSRLAENHRKWRALLAIVLLVAILAVFSADPFGSLDRETAASPARAVEGTVMEVNSGEGQSLRSGNTVRMVTARIALDDGAETRILLNRITLQPGERITLLETVRADGTRHFKLAN